VLPTLALVAVLAGCGGGGSTSSTTTTPPAAPSVTGGAAQSVTFEELRQSIERLYRRQPGIRSYVARDVEYTPKTRDEVLDVCRNGGPENDASARESARIAGCAPLVFFFYSYARQRSVPESLAVARQTYWYAVSSIRGPLDTRSTLTGLLRSWGVP
jgi:hypothetical protein